jgi:hypothetical protein
MMGMGLSGFSVTSTWNGIVVSGPESHDEKMFAPEEIGDLLERVT